MTIRKPAFCLTLSYFGRGYYPLPPFAYPSFLQNCAIPPDKQYLSFKNFAFHSRVDAVERNTDFCLIYYLYEEFLLA